MEKCFGALDIVVVVVTILYHSSSNNKKRKKKRKEMFTRVTSFVNNPVGTVSERKKSYHIWKWVIHSVSQER